MKRVVGVLVIGIFLGAMLSASPMTAGPTDKDGAWRKRRSDAGKKK